MVEGSPWPSALHRPLATFFHLLHQTECTPGFAQALTLIGYRAFILGGINNTSLGSLLWETEESWTEEEAAGICVALLAG